MGGALEKSALPVMQLAQPIHMSVQSLHQGLKFTLNSLGVEGIEAIRGPVTHFLSKPKQRSQLSRDTEPH
jgi:hypothetical protein